MRVLVLSDFTQKIDTTSNKLFKFEFNGVINPNEHSLWEDVSEFEIENLQKNLPGLIDSGVRKLQNDFKIESGENHKNLAFIEHISLNWIAILAAFIVQKKFEIDKLISLYQIDRILVDKPENFQFTSNMDLHSYLNHKDWNLWLTTLLVINNYSKILIDSGKVIKPELDNKIFNRNIPLKSIIKTRIFRHVQNIYFTPIMQMLALEIRFRFLKTEKTPQYRNYDRKVSQKLLYSLLSLMDLTLPSEICSELQRFNESDVNKKNKNFRKVYFVGPDIQNWQRCLSNAKKISKGDFVVSIQHGAGYLMESRWSRYWQYEIEQPVFGSYLKCKNNLINSQKILKFSPGSLLKINKKTKNKIIYFSTYSSFNQKYLFLASGKTPAQLSLVQQFSIDLFYKYNQKYPNEDNALFYKPHPSDKKINTVRTKVGNINLLENLTFKKSLQYCKLAIFASFETPSFEALAAGVPTIVLIAPNNFNKNIQKIILMMEDCGIFYRKSEDMINFIINEKNYENWWNDELRQKNLSIFLKAAFDQKKYANFDQIIKYFSET